MVADQRSLLFMLFERFKRTRLGFNFTPFFHFRLNSGSVPVSCCTRSLFLETTSLDRSRLAFPLRDDPHDMDFPNRWFCSNEQVSTYKDTPAFLRLSDIAILSQFNRQALRLITLDKSKKILLI